MQWRIRKGIFETNSSSSHTLCINGKSYLTKPDLSDDLLIPVLNRGQWFEGHEPFSCEEKWQEKLCYFVYRFWNRESSERCMDLLCDMFYEHTGRKIKFCTIVNLSEDEMFPLADEMLLLGYENDSVRISMDGKEVSFRLVPEDTAKRCLISSMNLDDYYGNIKSKSMEQEYFLIYEDYENKISHVYYPSIEQDIPVLEYDFLIPDELLKEFLRECVFQDSISINAKFYDCDYPPESGVTDWRLGFNGNVLTMLLENGTKAFITFENRFLPVYPSNIDVKLTDKCFGKCRFCHENSSPDGKDCENEDMFNVLKELPGYVELSFGGGNIFENKFIKKSMKHFLNYIKYKQKLENKYGEFLKLPVPSFPDTVDNLPLHYQQNNFSEYLEIASKGVKIPQKFYSDKTYPSYADFYRLVSKIRKRQEQLRLQMDKKCKEADFFPTDAIKTLTVHQGDFIAHIDYLKFLYKHNFIRAVGVSVTHVTEKLIECLSEDIDCVIHVINGVITSEELKKLYDRDIDLLILGFKEKGRGVSYHKDEQFYKNQEDLFYNLSDMKNHFKVISFDNLALAQLDINKCQKCKDHIHNYLGMEGEISMYVDMVNSEYGISSFDNKRWNFDCTMNVKQMYKTVLNEIYNYCSPD